MTNILAKFKHVSGLFEKRHNDSKTSGLPCSNPKSLKLPPIQPTPMMKVMMLGIAIAAIALSVVVAATISADEITSSTSISGASLMGPLPEVRISHLPEIGETAIVTVTYTNEYISNITDAKVQSHPQTYLTGWKVSPGFEIVDSGNMTAEPFYPPNQTELKDYRYFIPTPLNAGESVTYTFEVRAIKEGANSIGGLGYRHVEAYIHVYLDDDNTMLYYDHRALYPELHQPPSKMSKSERAQADEAEHLRQLAEAIKNPPPDTSRPLVGDDLIEAVTTWVVREGFTPEETAERLASHVTLTMDDIRSILIGAGFSEDEVNGALPADDAP